MNLFGLEEFASKKRAAQTRIEEALRPTVRHAVDLTEDTSGWDELLDEVEAEFYTELSVDTDQKVTLPPGWRKELRDTLKKTTAGRDERTVENITVWLATWILSQVSIAAANSDPEDLLLEWVDMGDGNVRPAHAKTAGQQRPPGEPFDVDGTKMPYPGWSGAPIELWINCRCTLRPVLADEFSMQHTVEQFTNEGAEMDPEKTEDIVVQWHGVLAPEGVPSGDGREFAPDSLTMRTLPLPLTWQKTTDDGHDGSVTVAKIERMGRVEGEMRGTGTFLLTTEADEVMALIAEFGKYGVSVDADAAEFDLDEEGEKIVFTSARICSASIVSIPAFAEAWVSLGPAPEGFLPDESEVDEEEVDVCDAESEDYDEAACEEKRAAEAEKEEKQAARLEAAALITMKDLAPGKTEDGPGWLTHPVDTDRLRDYWVHGEGAAKIAWGTPGDFNRCRVNLAEYIKPQYLSGYCANRHYDALGIWPGEHNSKAPEGDMAPAVSLVASAIVAGADEITAPAEWFKNPNLTEPTPLTVTKEGRVFGHIAQWGICHIGFDGVCVDPPRTHTNYGYFANKKVLLDDGTMANTGVISVADGHAKHGLRWAAAMDHYDKTATAAADVAVGEDEHGIWCSGWVRPGTTPEQIVTMRASGVSGDWREIGYELELVAALSVNSGGFPIKVAARGGRTVSLVAAGAVEPTVSSVETQEPNWDKFADAIIDAIEKRTSRRERLAKINEKVAPLNEAFAQERRERIAALAARTEEN